YSSAFLTLSLLTVMSPLAFTSSAPKLWKMAPQVSTESAVVPSPMPNGKPALWQAAAALRKVLSVQSSALGGAPAGYMAWTSMPACCFRRSMREVGPLNWAPGVAGTPSHLPSITPRYCVIALGRAVLLDQR